MPALTTPKLEPWAVTKPSGAWAAAGWASAVKAAIAVIAARHLRANRWG